MKNSVSAMVSSVLAWVRSFISPSQPPAATPEQIRQVLAAMLSDPQQSRLLFQSLLQSGVAAEGGAACDKPAGDINASTPFNCGAYIFLAANSSTTPLTVQGAASQSASLQEWKDSAGNIKTTVEADGSVGIGTTSPGTLLHIKGSGTGYLRVEANSANQYNEMLGFTNLANNPPNTPEFYFCIAGNAEHTPLILEVNQVGDVMTWTRDRNVGIGTTSPATKLHVEAPATDPNKAVTVQETSFAPFDLASWERSFVRIGEKVNNAGNWVDSDFSANEFGLTVQVKADLLTPPTSVNYEKAALLAIARTADPSTYQGTQCDKCRDVLGADVRGQIVGNNLTGRAWGLFSGAFIDPGSDGFLVGAEIVIENNASNDQPLVDQITSKYGIKVISSRNEGTVAIFLEGGEGRAIWHKGIYANPSHLGSGASDSFLELSGKFLVDPNGKVGIGTTSTPNILTVVQNSATDPIADAWTTYSSRRWKINIQTLKGALVKALRLRGVSYERKSDGKQKIGVIGEEVAKVLPEAVAYEENGTDAKSVDYAQLTALLIEAIKEQHSEILDLRKIVTGLAGARHG